MVIIINIAHFKSFIYNTDVDCVEERGTCYRNSVCLSVRLSQNIFIHQQPRLSCGLSAIAELLVKRLLFANPIL